MTTLKTVRKYFRCFKPSKCGTLNVLLVDDNLMTHESIKFRFKMLNWHLTSVYNGKEALTLYRTTRFSGIDLVLMALRMPVLGGQAATEALVRMGCNVPIVVLTSGSRNVEVKGAMGVLQKPLQIPQFIPPILSYRMMTPGADASQLIQGATQTHDEPPFRRLETSTVSALNVLLVDDNTMTHECLGLRAKTLDWHLTGVYNGKEALTLHRTTKFSGIDLVLMALRMPVLGGQAATEALVRMGCNVPIIILASGSRNVEVKGAMGVLQKPLQIPQLIKLALRTHTRQTHPVVKGFQL